MIANPVSTWYSSRRPAGHAVGGCRGVGGGGRFGAACVRDSATEGDCEGRHYRRAAQLDQTRALQLDLFYGTPSAHSPQARGNGSSRTASRSRDRFATAGTRRSGHWTLLCSSTGSRCFTFELKNSLTKQTADGGRRDPAVSQSRNPREKLLEFGRCIAHFAVDEREVQF